MKLSAKEINQIKNFFADKPVNKVYLFGSYARGEANDHSDVDLLIDWDYSKHIGLNYVFWKEEIKKLLNKEVDFVSVDYIYPAIAEFINKDKKLIYEGRIRK